MDLPASLLATLIQVKRDGLTGRLRTTYTIGTASMNKFCSIWISKAPSGKF